MNRRWEPERERKRESECDPDSHITNKYQQRKLINLSIGNQSHNWQTDTVSLQMFNRCQCSENTLSLCVGTVSYHTVHRQSSWCMVYINGHKVGTSLEKKLGNWRQTFRSCLLYNSAICVKLLNRVATYLKGLCVVLDPMLGISHPVNTLKNREKLGDCLVRGKPFQTELWKRALVFVFLYPVWIVLTYTPRN